jgi:hypothetical protein
MVPTAEATLFKTVSCASILRGSLHHGATEIDDPEIMRDIFDKIVTHYRNGEWIESPSSARAYIVGAGVVSRKIQYGGIGRLGFYIDALENPGRSGHVSVWVQDHDGFESMENGSAGAIEKLLRKWKFYCNQAEGNLADFLLAARLATVVTVLFSAANETAMGFSQALLQYSAIGLLGDWALRMFVASGLSYDELDARARQLGHAFGVTREAFSKPSFGTTTWAHFGVNLPDNRKIDLIILRDPDDGPAFQTILLGFDGIK